MQSQGKKRRDGLSEKKKEADSRHGIFLIVWYSVTLFFVVFIHSLKKDVLLLVFFFFFFCFFFFWFKDERDIRV